MRCLHFYQGHHQQSTDDELCDLSDTPPDVFETALPDKPPFSPFNQEHYTGRDSPPFLYPHPRGVPGVVATGALCGEFLVSIVRPLTTWKNHL